MESDENKSEKKKSYEGIPMSEEDYKEWEKVFTDMEEAIEELYKQK